MRWSPGCDCCESCLIFFDDYVWASQSGLNVTYDVEPSGSWIATSGVELDYFGDFASNLNIATNTTDDSWMILKTQTEGVEAHNVLRVQFAISSGVVVRSVVAYTDENNYLYGEIDTTGPVKYDLGEVSLDCGVLRIGEVSAGVDNQLGDDVPITYTSKNTWMTYYSASTRELASWIPQYSVNPEYGYKQNKEACQTYYGWLEGAPNYIPPTPPDPWAGSLIEQCNDPFRYMFGNTEHADNIYASGDRTGLYVVQGGSGDFSIAEYYHISPSADPTYSHCMKPVRDYCQYDHLGYGIQATTCNFEFDGDEYELRPYIHGLAISGQVIGVSIREFE